MELLHILYVFLFYSAIRHCQKTCTINGVTFLKGSDLLIPIYALHRSSEYWDEPDQFRPERLATNTLVSIGFSCCI